MEKLIRLHYAVLVFACCFFFSLVKAQPFENSILLNGNSDYVTVPDNNSLDHSDSISVEVWINPCKVSNDNFIVSKVWCSGSQAAYYLNVKDGRLVWLWDNDGYCGNTPSIYQSVNPIILLNQWQHVAVVHTTTGVSLYHNGSIVNAILASGSFGTINNSSESFRIGNYKSISGALVGYFNGFIDDLRIWNYDLSAAEIQSRMNNELSGNEFGLMAYYNMNLTGAGQGIALPNIAASTGATNNGTTVGTANSPIFISAIENILNLGNDTTLCEGEILILDATFPGASYLWQDNSTNPAFTVSQQGTYRVKITLNACSIRDTINILGCENNLFIPNVFTPNFDGINDFFIIKGNGISSLKTKIYNRWGNLIFESSSLNENWNGKTIRGEDCSEGIYFYIVIAEINYQTKTFYDSFTLLK